ncbi:MAG TPA: hypothetical protein VGH24_01590 [Solirubrobacteraceae bacterium]
MPKQQPVRWWSVRRAQNRKPATYRCPICDRYLPALSEHMLLTPEGDTARRRHAHTECVLAARKAGRLPTQEEWLRTQPRVPGRLRTLIERLRHSDRDGRLPR